MKVERIRSKYLKAEDMAQIDDPHKARKVRQGVRRGLSKLKRLDDFVPLKSEAIELFEQTKYALKLLTSKDASDAEIQKELQQTIILFEAYLQKIT